MKGMVLRETQAVKDLFKLDFRRKWELDLRGAGRGPVSWWKAMWPQEAGGFLKWLEHGDGGNSLLWEGVLRSVAPEDPGSSPLSSAWGPSLLVVWHLSSSGQTALLPLRLKAGQEGEQERVFPFVAYNFYWEGNYFPEASRRLPLASSDFPVFMCPWPMSMGLSGSVRLIVVHPVVLWEGSPLESIAPKLE